jgi:putative FmdB family regulatory protein
LTYNSIFSILVKTKQFEETIMPIYEYKCNKCGSVFSELRSITEIDPAKCDKCESDDTRKLISSFATSGSKTSGPSNCVPSGGG